MNNETNSNGEKQASRPAPAPRFRKYLPPSRLTREQCRRQTDVLRAACEHIVPNGAAIAFLNAHHEELGGVPLQLAIDSDHGLSRVERLLGDPDGRERGSAGLRS